MHSTIIFVTIHIALLIFLVVLFSLNHIKEIRDGYTEKFMENDVFKLNEYAERPADMGLLFEEEG